MNNDTPQPTVKESLTPQKPRCLWPVHEWHPNAVYCSVSWGSRFRLFDKDDYCVEVRDFKPAIDTKWTRAEALASQILDKPDRAGVWIIYEKHATLVDEFKDLTTTPLYDECDGTILYETIRGRWSSYSVLHSKFYYMGPLPESEVPSE